MSRYGFGTDAREVPRTPRSRPLLRLAVVSSAVIVILSSVLITSFFASGPARARAAEETATAAPGVPLTIALARTPGGSLEWRTYAYAIERMGRAVGRPMRVRYVDTPSSMEELLRTGRVDAAFTTTYDYLRVADSAGVTLVASPVIDGYTKDAAVLVVRAGSGFGALADLRGRRIGVTDPTSLAGYAYLLWLAEGEGIDVASSLRLVPGDSQEQNIRALRAGEVDAVVVNRSQLASWDAAGLSVVRTSPEFGMSPFVTGSTIDPATRDAMQRALLSMRPPSDVAATSVGGFSMPDERDYDFSRILLRYAGDPRGPS